jgi:hypothetical protein
MITSLLIAGLIVLWVLSLLARPFGRCWRCRGHGNIRSKSGRRAPKCWLCKGRGRRQRTGSRTVHRVRRQVAEHWRDPR